MTGREWTPGTPAEAIAWGVGYICGWNRGHETGRAAGYVAGREGLAGELVVALKLALSGVDQTDPPAVLRILAEPIERVIARHLRLIDQAETRRAWDATAAQPRPGDRHGTEVAA